MLILERSVTRKFWEKSQNTIQTKLKNKDFIRLQKTRVIRIDIESWSRFYVVTRYGRPIAWLWLWQTRNWLSWEVIQVFTLKEHRGKGLARALYKAAVNDDILLASGYTQSKSSRALWLNFIKKKDFNIFAIDFKNLNRHSQVFFDENKDLWCSLQIYDIQNSRKEDIRLIALRK